MNIKYSARQTFSNVKAAFTKNRLFKAKMISALVLVLMLTINVLPVGAVLSSPTVKLNSGQSLQAIASSFVSVADAYVDSGSPSANNGTLTTLRGDGSPAVNAYLRFNVQGLSGAVTLATLRIFANSSSSTGYDIHGVSDNTWGESTITYNNAPAFGGVLGSSGSVGTGVWTDVDVTAYITGNGSYNLALSVPGSQAISLASRESGANAPQLVIETSGGSVATSTPTQAPAATSTVTPTQVNAPTPTSPAGGLFNFISNADAYVSSNSKTTNFGTLTTLRGDGSPVVNSYLRFNVQGLSSAVTLATLRIFANSASSTGYNIRGVSDNTWGESTITYSNAPAFGGVLGSSGAVSSGMWTNVNVSAYITGNGSYNLALSVPSSQTIDFASRESGANAPQLIVQTGSGSVATSTATPISNPTFTPIATSTQTSTPNATNTPTPTPNATASGSVILVGAGDISDCGNNNDEATAKLLDSIPGTVFTAGDNAYSDGTYTQFVNCYNPTWGRSKARTNPSPGNHDYNTAGAAGYFQYFNSVTPYYAYNLGAWRIYALNSEISASATSAQVTWLQNDLAANPKLCVLAYWHKPRWSSGTTHGSDSGMQTLWQILYNAGADLVINGHEHNYERFAEMNALGSTVTSGLREIVVGTGGEGHYSFGTALPGSQVRNGTTYGVVKLTLSASGYTWQFVPVAGSTFTDSGSNNCH